MNTKLMHDTEALNSVGEAHEPLGAVEEQTVLLAAAPTSPLVSPLSSPPLSPLSTPPMSPLSSPLMSPLSSPPVSPVSAPSTSPPTHEPAVLCETQKQKDDRALMPPPPRPEKTLSRTTLKPTTGPNKRKAVDFLESEARRPKPLSWAEVAVKGEPHDGNMVISLISKDKASLEAIHSVIRLLITSPIVRKNFQLNFDDFKDLR